jgi:siroheme synthase-like protein
MVHYPIFLNLAGRKCVVVGGGTVAERKVERLLESGARVRVVSPKLTRQLETWAGTGKLEHVCREYQAGDLNGCELAFVATDDRLLNGVIHEHAQRQRIWINAADDPERCDFILPAVTRRGDLTVAVSTGGASPAVARVMREHLEGYLTEDWAQLVELASRVRRELSNRAIRVSADRWVEALRDDFRRLIDQGKAGQAKELLLRKLGVEE